MCRFHLADTIRSISSSQKLVILSRNTHAKKRWACDLFLYALKRIDMAIFDEYNTNNNINNDKRKEIPPTNAPHPQHFDASEFVNIIYTSRAFVFESSSFFRAACL